MSKNNPKQNLECLKVWLTTLKPRVKKAEKPEHLAPVNPEKEYVRIKQGR